MVIIASKSKPKVNQSNETTKTNLGNKKVFGKKNSSKITDNEPHLKSKKILPIPKSMNMSKYKTEKNNTEKNQTIKIVCKNIKNNTFTVHK